MKKTLIGIVAGLVITVSLTACFSSKKVTVENFHLYQTPPSGVKISDNFYCDQTEISNIDWMEYMFWNKKVFGYYSREYISTLLDTSVWIGADSCFPPNTKHYLRHPAYRHYPVVGVSQKQAEEYSKWRSDRVFEYILTKYEIITYDTAQTKENYFTIEKYYHGELTNVISDKKVYYYPEYRLPTQSERKQILAYSDSLNNAYFEKCKSKYCLYCKENYPEMQSDIVPCVSGLFKGDPTRNVTTNCCSKKGNPIYNLRGNVSEWLSEKDITAGGGWKDTRTQILTSDLFVTTEANAWTGFRNVCKWKKWEE